MFIVSVYFKVAFALLCVGLLFELIGFASPYWVAYDTRYGDVNMGLWQHCPERHDCYSYGMLSFWNTNCFKSSLFSYSGEILRL